MCCSSEIVEKCIHHNDKDAACKKSINGCVIMLKGGYNPCYHKATADCFEFNNGDEKVCFDSWPCENCSHTTYELEYYTDKSQFCVNCSVYNCNNRWCQFSKKEVKHGSTKPNNQYARQ